MDSTKITEEFQLLTAPPRISTGKTFHSQVKTDSSKTIKERKDSIYQLHHLAFNNSVQANIVSLVSSGKIILANKAACKLLTYSKKELLTKSRSAVFNINEISFKKMLKRRRAAGHSSAVVTALRKKGKPLTCEITSAIFRDDDGIEKSITTITDRSEHILKQKNIDTKKEKIVADNICIAISKQKNIDTIKEKKVADNIILVKEKQKKIDAIKEKVVSDNIIIANNRQKNIDIRKEKIVADNISIAESKQKDIDALKEKKVANNIIIAKEKQKQIDAKKEKIVCDNIALVISRQKDIDAKKNKTVATNIILARSKQKNIDAQKEKIIAGDIIEAQAKSNARVEENKKWIKYIAKASYDVMWDWDIQTGKVYIGDSIEEVFGYPVINNTMYCTHLQKYILPEEKNMFERKLKKALASDNKSWNDSYMIRRQDGSVADVTSRASIVRDARGKAIRLIGATQDVSKLVGLEKRLEKQIIIGKEYSEKFLLAANLSFDGIWDWNLLTNEFFLGEGFEEIFGHAIKKKQGNIATDWSNYLHPGDKKSVEKGLQDAIASSATHWEHAYRFVKADGSIVKVFGRANITRDANGKALRMIGVIHDINKQEMLEERLEEEIRLKEKQIAVATEEAKESERLDIGKELHDNVNQLLGASKLYINMAKHGGADSEIFLSRSSEYTLKAIEEIRKLTKGLTTGIVASLGLCEAIENIVQDTMEVDPIKISFTMDGFMESKVEGKFKLNIFRIIQEALNNILKHANAKVVDISLSQNEKYITLSISDNGVGFKTNNIHTGIGLSNIISRAKLYRGSAKFISQPGKGCSLKVNFPINTLSNIVNP